MKESLGFSRIPPVRRDDHTKPILPLEVIFVDTRSEWQPLSVANFPEGTVGAHMFTRIDPAYASGMMRKHFLEGRRRSPLLLDRPLSDLWPVHIVPAAVKNAPERSVRELLATEKDTAHEKLLKANSPVERTLIQYIKNLTISPSVSFANWVKKDDRHPVPVLSEREQVLEAAADAILEALFHTNMNPKKREGPQDLKRFASILIARFGLRSGVPEKFDVIGNVHGLSRMRTTLLMDRGLSYLYNVSSLSSYFSHLLPD